MVVDKNEILIIRGNQCEVMCLWSRWIFFKFQEKEAKERAWGSEEWEREELPPYPGAGRHGALPWNIHFTEYQHQMRSFYAHDRWRQKQEHSVIVSEQVRNMRCARHQVDQFPPCSPANKSDCYKKKKKKSDWVTAASLPIKALASLCSSLLDKIYEDSQL